jgi:hypothetical protein
VLKLFMPEMGLWIGSWGFVWGIPPDAANSRELLGRYFVDALISHSYLRVLPRSCCAA